MGCSPLLLPTTALPVGTYLPSFSPDDLVTGSLREACGGTDGVTKGFVDRGTNPSGIGCPMASHASDSSAPSNPLTAVEGLPTDSSCVTAVCLAELSCCSLTAIRSDLCRVAISPTNLASTSCCNCVCCSMASRSNLFSSCIASISSRIDEVSDNRLCVSSKLSSSWKCTVTIPRWINWSNFIWYNDVVRNSRAKYRRSLGPHWRTISSASCGGIQPTSSMSCSDAVFKFNGGFKVAMIQSDVQSVMSENDKKSKHKKYTNAQSHQWYLHCTRLSHQSQNQHNHTGAGYLRVSMPCCHFRLPWQPTTKSTCGKVSKKYK